ncbi:MAG TPA: type IV toxin-antitoxin system AbiEi family antitoxin domain-containing protein [Ilumatobacteraceae bacterium]
MDRRFTLLAAAAAETHGVFTTSTARYLGISDTLRNKWIEQGKIERVGRHTFCFAGVPKTWHMMLAARLGDHSGVVRPNCGCLARTGIGFGTVRSGRAIDRCSPGTS